MDKIQLSETFSIKLDEITPHDRLKKRQVEPEENAIFRNDIKINGVLDPVICSRVQKNGKYLLLNGKRRFETSKSLNLSETIPVRFLENETDRTLRRVLYGMNNFPKSYKESEMVSIIHQEYRTRLWEEYRGGGQYGRKTKDFVLTLSQEISEDFGISERRAQQLLKAAREQSKKEPDKPELQPGELKYLKNLFKQWNKLQKDILKFEKEIEKIDSSRKEIRKKQVELEKEARKLGGFEVLQTE